MSAYSVSYIRTVDPRRKCLGEVGIQIEYICTSTKYMVVRQHIYSSWDMVELDSSLTL